MLVTVEISSHRTCAWFLYDCTTEQWDETVDLARGEVSLCDQNGLDVQRHTFHICQGLVAAYRGHNGTAAELAAKPSDWALPRSVHLLEYRSA